MASSAAAADNGEGASRPRADALDSDTDSISDADDPVLQHSRDRALLDDDFLDAPEGPPISFKRKQKQPAKFSLPRLLQPLDTDLPAGAGAGHVPARFSSARVRQLRQQSARNHSDPSLASANGSVDLDHASANGNGNGKEGAPLDWLGDGPRRGGAYDDGTAIDWIFEYSKERARVRALRAGARGLLGQAARLWDAGQVWLVLIATGAASGVLAAAIDVASDWLGDLKTGFCAAGRGGGQFYLSRGFCCWGYDTRRREVLSAAAAAGISVAFGSPIGGVLFSLEQLSFYFPDKTMWQSFVCAMVAAVTLQVMNPFRTDQLVLYQVTYTSGYHAFELLPFALLGIVGGLYGGLFIRLNMRLVAWRERSRLAQWPVLEVFIVALGTALVNFPDRFMRAQSSELVHVLFAECASVTDDTLGICRPGASGEAGTVALLLLAAALGFGLAAATFGLRLPAGVILPSMAIGALYGRVVGIGVQRLQQARPDWLLFQAACAPDRACVTPGTYAVVGAASALGGATRMTVSVVVIMFELTGALTYVLPIMVAVLLSKWVGDALGRRGVYESWIRLRGYPFLDNRDDAPAPDVRAQAVMTPAAELATLAATGHTLESLGQFLLQHPFRGFPVVADSASGGGGGGGGAGNVLLGYITRAELAAALRHARAPPRRLPPDAAAVFAPAPHADPGAMADLRAWMDTTPLTLHVRAPLQLAVDLFLRLGLTVVLFVEQGRLRGLLTKKDVWYILESAEDNGGGGGGGGGVGEEATFTPRPRASESRGLLAPITPGEGMLNPFDLR